LLKWEPSLPAKFPSLADIEVVAPSFKRRYSGITSTIVRLVPLQAETVRIVCTGPNLPGGLPQITTWNLLRLAFTRPSSRPFRIWHARRNIEMLAGLLLKQILRSPMKLVFTSAAQRHHTAYTRFLIRQMDAVIATTAKAESYLQVPATVMMHGVDIETFVPAVDRRAEWAAGGLPGTCGIGCFGRIRHQKGTDLFVETMIRVLPDFPEYTAVILGLATPDNAAFENELKSKIAAAGLSDRIHFLGELSIEEVVAWFRRLSLFIAPQRWEGFGLTPLEAMASAVPVVATTVGAFPEIVIEGETGYLVPPDDLASIERATRDLLADPARLAIMSKSARRHVEEHFPLRTEVERINAVYETVWNSA
jgi:mannosyltransferase